MGTICLVVVLLCGLGVCAAVDHEVNPRIIGGENAKSVEFPWNVVIQYVYNKSSVVSGLCGGSIINANTLLTSGNCVSDDPEQKYGKYLVTAGVTRFAVLEPNIDAIHVSSIVMHPRLCISSKKNNIALIILDTPLNFTRNIQPVILADTDNDIAKSTNCFIHGFGLTSQVPWVFPKVLQKANVDILRHNRCAKLLFRKAKYRLSENHQFCTFQPGIALCNGDAGIPVGCFGSDGVFRQVGVASSRTYKDYECEKSVNVYTKVTPYLKWIEKNSY